MRLQERSDSWEREIFLAKLRTIGASRYHDKHPFHRYMNNGQLDREQIKGWAANRFYYQKSIPLKDAAIISNCPIREVRRLWLHRVSDHDGVSEGDGGIEAWLKLADAVGLNHRELLNEEYVLPGVRFAVDAYVNFVRQAPWEEGICSSLTELFAPEIHQQRLNSWPDRYPWIEAAGLQYFRNRLSEARRDVEHGLAFTLAHFNTRPLQERALAIVQFKLDVLWCMLDAMMLAYVLDMPPYFTVHEAP